jgi:hypothetical protein
MSDDPILPEWYLEFCDELNAEWLSIIKNKIVIFLDTKLYIKFRDAIRDPNSSPQYYRLYNKLVELVEKKIVICPIIENVFFELLKRKEEDDIRLVFKIVGKLSNSLMQCNISQICEYEFCAYRDKIPNKLYVYKIQSQHCSFPIYGGSDLSKINENKKILRMYFNEDISKLFELIIPDTSYYDKKFILLNYLLMKENIKHGGKQQFKSYAMLEKFEFNGLIDLLYTKLKTKLDLGTDFIDELKKEKYKEKYIPFIQNSSKLNAFVRWSELNNLETNDTYCSLPLSFPIPSRVHFV